MKKKLFTSFMMSLAFLPGLATGDYNLPDNIQEGNILHCFNWSMADVKAELQSIAEAGFGSVQLSPLQRDDVQAGYAWHDLYRPYDLSFKASSGMGSADDLKSLCEAAEGYGIKIIVDVVANHVDKTAGYHDTWWDSNGRVRWNGSINYNDRYSITHGQLGDYGDINSEDSEVIAKGKSYVEYLKSLGVKGIRWDAAKHIGLPSEGCNFWSSVASVSGMYHYGEILDNPGPDASIIKEYTQYMSVTDNQYSNYAARDNGGIPTGYGGSWAVDYGLGKKVIYWAESHDTYSNDEWSQNVDQSVIDRAYAAYACRNDAAALYLSRPNTKGFSNIKLGKGSTAFKSKQISEVNKFRNLMNGRADYFTSTGSACSITRKDGGAVIVMKGSGNVSIANGGGYCPAGTYTDRVSGGQFTVTASTISGTVGSSGIAVIYSEDLGPIDPTPTPTPTPGDGGLYILGNLEGSAGWSSTPGTGMAMTQSGTTYTATGVKFVAASGETKCFFNLTDYVGSTWDDLNMKANRYGAATEGSPITLGTATTIVKYANNVDASGCLSWTIDPGTYDITADLSSMKLTVVSAGDTPTPTPTPTPGSVTITGDYNLAYSGTKSKVYYWPASSPEWPGVDMASATGSDGKTYKVAKVPDGTTGIIFNNGGDDSKTGDLTYTGSYIMDDNGATTTAVTFQTGTTPTPTPTPGDGITIYYDNSNTNWSTVYIHYWETPSTDWPGVTMTKVEGNIWKYTFTADTSSLKGFLFGDGDKNGGNGHQTDDYLKAPVDKHLYKGANANKGAVTDEGEYDGGDDPQPTKPVVTASPASGSRFTSEVTVTLTVSPAATIYYTINGTTPSTSSTVYSQPLTFTETTTLKTLAVTSEGGKNEQTFTYTKGSTPVDPTPGSSLITDYYKVNPNGQYGTNRTVNMTFTKLSSDNRMCVADNALSNWTEADLIAQGVARDVAGAIRGKHEYPCVDSYAIYAAYDANNLYLGVQYVYTVWDEFGTDGILTNGAAKPYNMDGRLMIAFDLDPDKSMDGTLTNGNTIWDADRKYNMFNNGTDCIWLGSTKSTVGTPGLFFPNESGQTSYDAPYCVSIDAPFYGCADGLLPSITSIWGQKDFEYDPEILKTNDNFVDLISKVPTDQHTFYEWKFPLSKLGINESYIKNYGIGVMVIDTYGQGATGSTPYDPTCFDNANTPYSKDNSSSAEKEDTDIFTYSHARIGKAMSAVDGIAIDSEEPEAEARYFNLQGIEVKNPSNGIYIVKKGNKVTKQIIR